MSIQQQPQQLEYLSEFDQTNKEFIEKLDGIKETYPLVMIFSKSNYFKTNNNLSDFLKKHGTEEQDEDGKMYYKFDEEGGHKMFILKKKEKIADLSISILPNSLFVSLISQFDAFLGKLIRLIFITKPEILNSSEKNISFSKLSELKSFDEAKEYMIEKEIESVLRESHSEHFLWIENKLKITLRKDLDIWKTFIEITERRNLLVHNNGIVTSQYLVVCRSNNVSFEKEPQLGDALNVDEEYFSKAFKCLYELSVKLTQVIWRKLSPNEIEKSDESLNDICFELIRNEQYELAIILLEFATKILKKHYNEESKNVLIVNLALANKFSNKNDICKDIVANKDWSACSDKFKIAKSALIDDFEQIEFYMRKNSENDEIPKLAYKTWPLFAEFRKQPNFETIYKEIFKEDYIAFELPKSMIEEIHAKVNEVKPKKKPIKQLKTVSKKQK